MVEVRLDPWTRDLAGYVARKLLDANSARGDAAHYDRRLMEPDEQAQVASCCAEVAVAKHLNRYWHAAYMSVEQHRQMPDLPDVGDNIEVKRIRSPQNPLAIRKVYADLGRAMVLAYPVPPDYTTVHLIGWGWAADLWPLGKQAEWDRSQATRLVPQGMLRAL